MVGDRQHVHDVPDTQLVQPQQSKDQRAKPPVILSAGGRKILLTALSSLANSASILGAFSYYPLLANRICSTELAADGKREHQRFPGMQIGNIRLILNQ